MQHFFFNSKCAKKLLNHLTQLVAREDLLSTAQYTDHVPKYIKNDVLKKFHWTGKITVFFFVATITV